MQDREPDEFRESTSFFQIWLLFRQNRVALFCFYLFCLLILTALLALTGCGTVVKINRSIGKIHTLRGCGL